MKHSAYGVAAGCVLGIFIACTAQEAKNAENFITDITDAVCAPLEQTNNLYVDFICAIAEATEGVVTVLTDTTKASATLSRAQLTVRIPAARAPQFAAEHTAAAVAARKAARGK
jgi:hypothetical protein